MTEDKTCTSCAKPARKEYILTALLIAAGLFYFISARSIAQAEDAMPGLVVYNGMGMGGLGRLDYDAERRAYALLDGRFTPFVVDNGTVRAMRVDEGGGSMAIPTELASIDGAIYGFLPSYNAIMKITPDSQIDKLGGYGDFAYGGGMNKRMDVHDGNLFFFHNNRLLAFSPALEKLGELVIENIRTPHNNYVITGNSLYYFESEDTGPYTDCVFLAPEGGEPPADQRCGERYSIMTVVDISKPGEMRVISHEKRADESPATYARFVSYDAQQGHWLLAGGRDDGLQLRTKDSFNTIADTLAVDGAIYALTRTPPFYMLRWNGQRMVINAIATKGEKLTLGPDVEIGLAEDYQGAVMKRHGENLFITARGYLRVVKTGTKPEVIMMQDFTDNMGDRFQFEDFAFADGLPPASTAANRERLSAILQLDYISRERQIELQSEVEKLTPEDEWAVPLLANVVRQKGKYVNLYPMAAQGLGNTGKAAIPAIPDLLNASMIGAGIRGDFVPHLANALRQIDPDGEHVVAALPAFIDNNYAAGAKSVAKQVLEALPGDAAKNALKDYQKR